MPLLYICATSASSWSFTKSSLSSCANKFWLLFTFCRSRSVIAADLGNPGTKLLANFRGSQPTCAVSRHQKVACQLRTSQLLRFRSKRRDRHQSRGHNDHSPNKTKSRAEHPVYRPESSLMDYPSGDPGDCPRQQHDRQKNRQKPRQVRECRQLCVLQKPWGKASVPPSRQQEAQDRSRQTDDLKEKTLGRRKQRRKQHDHENGPIQRVHAIPASQPAGNSRPARTPYA